MSRSTQHKPTNPGRRLALLLTLLAATAWWATTHYLAQQSAPPTYREALQRAAAREDFAQMRALLAAEDSRNPQHRALNYLLYNAAYPRDYDTVADHVLKLLEASPPRVETPPPRATLEQRSRKTTAGAARRTPTTATDPAIVVTDAGKAGALFVAWARALGVADIGASAPSSKTPTLPSARRQAMVVAAGGTLPQTQQAPQRILWLGPGKDAERSLALPPTTQTANGCVMHLPLGGPGDSADRASTARPAIAVPLHLPLRRYTLSDSHQVIATATCSDGGVVPALIGRHAQAEPAMLLAAFDLLDNLRIMRQGRADLANRENDGVPGLRPTDLYPPAHKIDDDDKQPSGATPSGHTPGGDRLIEWLITWLEGNTQPTARFWPHPAGYRSTMILTSDQDFVDDRRLRIMMHLLNQAGARATFFLTSDTIQQDGVRRSTAPLPATVELGRRIGMDFGTHPWLQPFPERAAELLQHQVATFKKRYGFTVQSNRFHFLHWWGYLEPVKLLAEQGVAVDLSYMTLYHGTGKVFRYMTGSGFALPFFDSTLQPQTVWQLATQVDDMASDQFPEFSEVSGAPTVPTDQLRLELAAILQSSSTHHHSPVVVNNHPYQFFYDPTWLVDGIGQAQQHGVAIHNVNDRLLFMQDLRQSTLRWDASRFTYHATVQPNQLQLLVRNAAQYEIRLDGKPVYPCSEMRYDRPVMMLTLPHGHHTVAFVAK